MLRGHVVAFLRETVHRESQSGSPTREVIFVGAQGRVFLPVQRDNRRHADVGSDGLQPQQPSKARQ